MNATCLFCHSRLERNELIETFPVGRRLAWREAEEIAAIADTLLIPPWIEEWLEKSRRSSP